MLLSFNVHNDVKEKISEYLREGHLFGDEPTISDGPTYSEFNIELNAANKKLPLARVRYDLAKHGATNIETIPLDSSIPGIDCIDF